MCEFLEDWGTAQHRESFFFFFFPGLGFRLEG